MNLKTKAKTILHFHTDFLYIPQFQLLSLSRWLAETGVSRWAIAVTSCLIRPLQHHDVRRHLYTDCGNNSHIFTSKRTQADDHKDTHTKEDKTKSIQVYFNIQSLDEACLPWKRFTFLQKSPSKSTVVLRSPTEVWRDEPSAFWPESLLA